MSKAKTKWEQRKEKIGYVPAESSAPEYSNAARESWENRPQTKARRSNSFSAYTDKEIEMLLQNNPAYVYAQAYGTRKTLTKGSDALAYGKKKEEERKPGQINAMGAGDYGASNPTRFDKTVNAAIYGAGASLSNLFGLLDEKDAQTRARDEADSARLRAGREASLQGEDINMREGGLKNQSEDSKKDFDERAAKLAGAGQKAFDRADRLQQTAYDYEQSAKAGLGKFGRGMVDFGIAATQFAGDAVMNAVLPGSGLAMMGARAAGGASHEARLAGKDIDTQLVTGLKSAAIEIMTEKLFGAVSHVAYGKGIIRNESLVNGIVNKLAKTDAGRTALKVIVGANEEGLEEVLSDILNPIADRILKLDDGNGDWSTIGNDFDAEEMAKDYIIGAALGLVGAGTNVISGQYKAENAQQRAYEDYQKRLVEAGLHTESGSDVQVTAEQYKNILDKSAKRGNRNLSDKETKNLEALMRNSYAQEDAADINSRLTQLGTQPDEQTVNAIVKALNGEKLSTKEQRAFEANPYSQRVVNEMLDPYGITTNEWYADRASMGEFEPEKGDVNTWERMQNVLDRSNVNGIPKRAGGGNAATENSVEHKTASAMSAKYNVPSDTISRVYRLNPASPQAFEQGFDAAYKMGQQGAKKAALGSITVLNQAQAEIAYKMGADTTQEVKTDGVYLRDGSKRADGENTEGQAPAVERGAGKADSGADSRAKGIARKDQGKAGEEVVYGGVKQKGIYYAKTDTAEMKSGREIAKNHGYDVVYFAGGNIETDGVAFRASIDTDSHTVTVRADHPDYSVDQLLRHELMHETINSGDADLSEIRSKLLESLSESELDELIDAYSSAYGGILSSEEAFEEICCDAMGKMNIFEGTQLNSESYEKALSLVREYAADKGSNKSRAPPEKGEIKYSEETVIDLSDDSKLARLIATSGKSKYNTIRNYVFELLGGRKLTLSDGRTVIVDKTDAKELAHKANDRKTAEIASIERIVQEARYFADDSEVTHNKFDYFAYYFAPVRYKGKMYNVIVNVGRAKNDGVFHLYDLTNDIKNKRIAGRLSGLSGPVGNRITNDSHDVTIHSSSENVNKKFSMEAPVEQKKNLIALHNLDETKLLKTLKLGGFPMPSIAITKSDIPHTNFGNITVVFGKETVDPKFDRRNTVYSADAWTPLFPRIEYEANEKAASKIRNRYYALSRKFGYELTKPMYASANYVDDVLTKYGGEDGVIEHFADDTEMMNVFLADTGRGPVEPVQSETVTRLTDEQIKEYDVIIKVLGKDTLNEMTQKANQSPLSARKQWLEKHGDELKSAFEQYLIETGMDEAAAKEVMAEMRPGALLSEAVSARNYLRNGAETRIVSTDTKATKEAIRSAVNAKEYKAWLKNLYSGIVKDSGVYNNKDYYTPSGNRRSFKATHYPNTLDGIVKAMASQGDGNSRNVMGFHGVKSLRAGTAERFKSVEDMHKLEGRLKHLTAEEASQISDALDSRLSELMHDIYNLVPHSGYSNELMELDSIGEVFMEATELKYVSPANVKALFKKYNYPLTDKIASDIVALLFDVNNMPVNIFEAKPERAVGFDEIRKVIIPDTSSDELRTALKNAGIESVEEYAAGDDAARMKIANDVPNVHFSLEPVKPIQPKNSEWERGSTTVEVRAKHPDLWAVDAESSESRNPTQITGTVKSYRKIYDTLKAEGFDGTILDASSGLGYGTRAGIEEYGFNVEDIEPFPDSSYKPKYTDYSKLNKKYDVIISNAVLNVLPQDQRDALTVKMGQMLNDGGRMFVNVRGSDVRNASSKVAIDEANMEYYISNTGSYQKGFTKKELVAYLSDALGNGYTVVGTNKFGAVSAVVTKNPSSAVKYSREASGSIKQQLHKSENELNKMEPVAIVNTPNLNKMNIKQQRQWAENLLKNTGYAVIRKDFGKIEFSPKHINEGLNYLNSPAEVAAFAALPRVLKRGMEIDVHAQHKGRPRNSITIAAPVHINGVRGNMGVAVTITTKNHYHAHRILLPDGSEFTFNTKKVDSTPAEAAPNAESSPIKSTFKDSIRNSDGNVNKKFSREPETLNELRRQNTQLKKRVEYWRGQAKTTRVKTVREGDVKKLAREIIEMNATDLKPKDITEQLGELGKYILNSEELRYTDISKMADDIASDVIENATAILNTDDVELHNELKDYLRSVKLLDDGSAEFAELRSKYKRRIMFKKNGLPVDVAYMELRGMFGETYFPEDIINVADQLERIGEVLDLTEPRYHNPNDYYSTVAREYLRNYIIDAMLSDEVRQTAPTYADRKEAQIAKLKADNAQAMRDEREKQAQKIASIKERNAQRIKDAVAKERERGEKRLERLRDSVERRDAKRKDIAEKERYKAQIEKNVKALSDWLLKPDHKNALKHIPGELQSTVRDFIASIDFTSARRLGGGDLTIKDTDYLHNLERLHKFVSDSNLGEDRYSGYLDLPPNFEAQLGDFIREVNGLARRNSGYTINDMTAAQLKELSDIVKVMKKTITDMNRMYQNATFRFAYDAGASDVENLVNIANTKPFLARNITSTIDNFVMWQQARPAHAFARFGEGGKSICRELMEGQSEMAFLTKKIIDFSEETYTTEEVKAWAKETHTFRFGDDTVTMTTAQLMGLYELSKRAQAQQHLETGGFKIANFKDKGDKIKRDTGHRLNEIELGKMFSELTGRQKEVADKLQQFMAKTGGEWGNYVSVKRFDVEMFKDENYYPINVKNTEVNTKEDQSVDNASLYKLLNMGFAKELSPKANQAIVVYDIFDVFSNHMAEMAQYRSFALPVLDAMKWFNYKERDESGRVVYSLREEMSRVFGSDEKGNGYAERFVSNILRAYNGTEASGSTYETLGMKSLSFYNRAAVAYNMRVVAQQPTAIARAAIILNEKDLASGFAYVAKNFKATAEEMEAHSGIALWKSLGFYDVNIGKGVQELIKHDQKWVDRFLEVGMKGAEFADRYTWAAMWEACKRDVRRKGIKDGDAQFFDKVSELFDEVIYKTQVVDSVLTKNEWGRSKKLFPRMMGSFMSEPATTASMVTDAIFNIQLDRERGMEWSEIKKKHNATVGKVIEVYALQAILTSLLAAISDAKRDDDDYATFAEKLWDSFKGNLGENLDPLNWYIFASDVVDLGKQILGQLGFDTYGYGQQNVWLQGAEQLLKAIEITRDLANDEKTNYTAFGAAMKWIQAGSQFAGLPAYNIARELYSTWNTIIGDFLGYKELKIKTYDPGPKKSIKYAYMDGYLTEEEAIEALQDESTMGEDVLDADKAWLEVEKWKNDTSSNYAKLYNAIDTDGDIKAAVNELVEHGVDAGKIKSAITRKYKDAYINGDAQERERIRKAMYATGLYGSANEIVEKCNSWLK